MSIQIQSANYRNALALSKYTAGSVIFADANGKLDQDNANLFWNDTQHYFGIGTNTPGYPLHVKSSSPLLVLQTTNATGNTDFFLIDGGSKTTWDFFAEYAFGRFGFYDATNSKYALFAWPNPIGTLTIGNAATAGYILQMYDNVNSVTALQINTTDTLTLGKTISSYNGLTGAGICLPYIVGADTRTGLTSADASPITLYSVTASGGIFEINGALAATSYTSGTATYTIKWTDITNTVRSITMAVLSKTETYASTVITRAYPSTAITVQITGTFSATLDATAIIKQVD